MNWPVDRLGRLATAWPSNVDKHSVEGQSKIRLCNYTDVYNNRTITDRLPFMRATASEEQINRFRIRLGDTLITKDSETADDIGVLRTSHTKPMTSFAVTILRSFGRTSRPRTLDTSIGRSHRRSCRCSGQYSHPASPA
ncbi:hypothetical protein GCM10025869_25300 [Homoserinibacter gongjuensis]|uniref:Uncharacterized protein n=1 Tax=Homoserinibacter gongjuensis TaxID=1162968 RepID=A0ABQ6JZK0_9MICO|nr:hypothetical protein GCM10025869_25300 [Homoserinibacter gongjuensis]